MLPNNKIEYSNYLRYGEWYHHRPDPSYMQQQTEISAKSREILIDWLIEVHHVSFKLRPATLFLTVHIIDRFLQRRQMTRVKLQLLGCTAMLIASKYHEIYSPDVKEFVILSDELYTNDEVRRCEQTVLETLEFELGAPSCLHFAEVLLELIPPNAKQITDIPLLCLYFMEQTLQHLHFLRYYPSTVAASAITLAISTLAPTLLTDWQAALCQSTHYENNSELKACLDNLFNVATSTQQYNAVCQKYTSDTLGRVASYTPRLLSLTWTSQQAPPPSPLPRANHNEQICQIGDYQRLEKLGEGTFGVVYKAVNKVTGETVALKEIRDEDDGQGLPVNAVREIAALKELRHPNIVLLKDALVTEGSKRLIILVFEFVEQDLNKCLGTFAREEKNLPLQVVKSYLHQLLQGIAFCHSRRFMHRDLKTVNVLVSREGVLKLADFGLARSFAGVLSPTPHSNEIQTLWYRAPEVMLGAKQVTTSADIWSIGCIFAELCNNVTPFAGDCEINQLFKIFQALGTPTEQTWPGVSQLANFKPTFPQWLPQPLRQMCKNLDEQGLDLLGRLLMCNPAQRTSADDALGHPWFGDMHSQSRCHTDKPTNMMDTV